MARFLGLTILVLGVLGFDFSAFAGSKVALVIGNDAYTQVAALERAVSDARAYRDMLSSERGFDVVYAENADRDTMISKIGEFLGKVRRDDVAMVVYSGHGVQLDPNRGDTLYLLPTDIPSVDPGSGGASFFMDARAINFARLSTEVEGRGAALRLFVLDACRNNPFPAAEGGRSIGLTRGLGSVRSSRGEFIFFAAAPGEVALDLLPGDDQSKNSVFTRVFLKHFREGEYLEDVANEVQEEVLQLSRQAAISQEPYYTDGVAGKTCIDSQCGIEAVAAPVADTGLEQTYWRLCETRDTASYCQAYLDTYPDGQHAPLARLRIDELAALSTDVAKPRVVTVGPASVTDAKPGDSAAGPAAPKVDPVATPEPAAEPDTKVAAVEPTAPVPSYEQQHQEEEARLARERTAQTEWKKLEDSWDTRAIRRFMSDYSGTEPVPEAERRLAWVSERFRQAQSELNRLGYNAGPVDGDWGPRSARALSAFQGENGLARTGVVSEEVLYRLRSAEPRVVAKPEPQPAVQPQPATQPQAKAEPAEPAAREQTATVRSTAPQPQAQSAQQPADNARVATLTPATGSIREGETWVASAKTPHGSLFSATVTLRDGKYRLTIDFDHRGNAAYYAWLVDHYEKRCSSSASDPDFECWMHGDVSQSKPTSPGARITGKFPRLFVQADALVGTATLTFAPR